MLLFLSVSLTLVTTLVLFWYAGFPYCFPHSSNSNTWKVQCTLLELFSIVVFGECHPSNLVAVWELTLLADAGEVVIARTGWREVALF